LVVAALERGLVRHRWEPTLLEPTLMVTAGRAFDHDDPAASDRMAGLAGTGQAPSGTGQAPSGTGQAPSGTGQAPSGTGQAP